MNEGGRQQLPRRGRCRCRRRGEVLAFEGADGSPLIFEGVDVDSLNIASATTSTSSSGTSTTTLDPETDGLYHPLRIAFDARHLVTQMEVALSAGDSIAATRLYLLIYEVLPMTARVWGDILRVIPVTGGIYPLAARGSGVDLDWDKRIS